ncbi:MAG: TIGR04372 family glycosyltransferase [Desulfobacterales bacterium]|jgi:putative glycosyltransferase (TIGR04372 family)|nr:TIGR04372 family glycosyltransferase [Desulfobacterales bacterium]MDP6808201.1 TIGR04372 family glycosyltransferase [Desulfobacterales bacterium]|tara:strand:+ start:23800 stop:25239 length:1440 start_codon:yes stop_codon:yes gene_type:complete
MELIQKVKRRIGGQVLEFFRRHGLEIHKTQGLDLQMRKLQAIKNHETRLRFAEKLVRQHPEHPQSHLELAKCLHHLSDNRQFKQMERYDRIFQEWMVRTGIAELDMEFISPVMVVGSFGNHYAIEGLIRANQYGLRHARKPFLLLPESAQLCNRALFEYFEPHLHVVRDGETIQALKQLESLLTLPLGWFLPMDDGCPFLDLAANRTEVEREKLKLEPALFRLSDRHREMGVQALKQLGLPGDAWYVTLHVREPGYHGETRENTTENWRNGNPLNYLKACEAVTRAGGWVFRMGDPSMTPLPSMSQVVDYAHHEIRCDWMDIFLGASCRFLITSGSGWHRVPGYFGIPSVLTDYPGFVAYYSMRSYDLYLPRWLKKLQTGELLSFREYMSPPVGMFLSDKSYRDAGLYLVENTPEELEAVTQEMLERTDDNHPSTIPDNDTQRRFKALTETCGLNYGGRPVKAFAPLSRDFLEKYAELL